jgi:hypothetical protein
MVLAIIALFTVGRSMSFLILFNRWFRREVYFISADISSVADKSVAVHGYKKDGIVYITHSEEL